LAGFIGLNQRSTFPAMPAARASMTAKSNLSRRYATALVIALVTSVAIVCVALTHAVAHMQVFA
jgi:hypothetical protein